MRTRFLSALAATTVLAACSADKSAAGDGGGTMIVSVGADAGSLFPITIGDETAKIVCDQLFEHLVEIGDGMQTTNDAPFEPRLASSWDWNKDSTTISFHINPKARFHDGVPVRANDVRYSFQLLGDSALGAQAQQLVGNIDSVSVVDSLTAKFWYRKHLPEQLFDVAYQVPIVPEHIYGKVKPADMATSEVMRHPIGTGRFRLARWEPGVRIELVADTANYRGRAKLDRVVFLAGAAPTAAATAVLTGESDLYPAFPIDQVDRLDSSKVARALPHAQMSYGFLGLNMHARKSSTQPHPVLSLPVRRAISMALDRKGMLANVFNNAGILAHGPFPSGIATADSNLRVPPFDTTAARALLDSAGWKVGENGMRQKNGRPLEIEVMVPTSSSIRVRYAELIQEQLRHVGIQANVTKLAFPAFVERQNNGDFDAVLTTISSDPNVAGTRQYWSTDAIAGQTNFMRYSNARVDAMLDSAVNARNPKTVTQYARKAYQLIADDAPAVWLYNGSVIVGVNRRFETKPFRANGWWAHLDEWSIPADKRIDRDRVGLRTAGTP